MATSSYKSFDIQSISKYWEEYGIKHKKNEICFCWNSRVNDFNWLTSKDVRTEFKSFKKQRCFADKENNAEFTDKDGCVWYGLTIQVNNDMPLDVGALAVAGLMVSGHVYWFSNELNRNAMFQYINKVDLSKFMKL